MLVRRTCRRWARALRGRDRLARGETQAASEFSGCLRFISRQPIPSAGHGRRATGSDDDERTASDPPGLL